MAAPSRADVKDADDWWATLTDQRRVSLHRWQAGLGKAPLPQQDEALLDVDGQVTAEASSDTG